MISANREVKRGERMGIIGRRSRGAPRRGFRAPAAWPADQSMINRGHDGRASYLAQQSLKCAWADIERKQLPRAMCRSTRSLLNPPASCKEVSLSEYY